MPMGGQKKEVRITVPAVTQWDGQGLWSTGTQAGSPAQPNGLRIQCCCRWGIGCNCCLDLIPGWGTPYAMGWPNKQKVQFFWILHSP